MGHGLGEAAAGDEGGAGWILPNLVLVCGILNLHLSVYLSIYHPSIYTYLPIYLSTYLPIYLSTYLSIYLSIDRSIYLSIYLCMCLIYSSVCMYVRTYVCMYV